MLIIDSHLDLALNAVQLNRDLTLPAYTLRSQEGNLPREWGWGQGTVALPDMRRGRVALCFSTLLARSTGRPRAMLDYPSPAQAYAVAQGHLAYYCALEASGHIRLIGTKSQLESHLEVWKVWDADHENEGVEGQPPLGFVISMESADPILTPDQLKDWYDAGVRVIGPAHYGPGRYAGGTGTEAGLSEIGVSLIEEMARLNMSLDMTHFSDAAFWQALEIFDGAILASHNNCRALVPHQRQFDDRQLQAIIARDGVIGAAFDNWMLRPGWTIKTRDVPVTIAHVVDHIDHICQLAGNARHAGIGSDLDGAFGKEQSPDDLDTIADVQQVAAILAGRGYSTDDITAIMYGNWLRVLRRVLPA